MNAKDETKKAAGRVRSEVSFPYYDMAASIEVPKIIHDQAGGGCTRDQLAPLLGYSGTKNGGYVSRLGAARMFGLIDEAGGVMRPTTLANQIISPVQSGDRQRGLVTAFLSVELFSRVYERFKGQTLPSQQGLENLLRNEFKIVPTQIKTALRNLQESANMAGFFDAGGRGRLVMPISANTVSSPTAEAATASVESKAVEAGERHDARSDGLGDGIPPAIYGLIRDLPPEGTFMSSAKRQRLIKAFEASINWLYPDSEEEVTP